MRLNNLIGDSLDKMLKLYSNANHILEVNGNFSNFVKSYDKFQSSINNHLQKNNPDQAFESLVRFFEEISEPFIKKSGEYLESGRNPEAVNKTLESILDVVYNNLDDEAKHALGQLDPTKNDKYIDYCNSVYRNELNNHYSEKDFANEENPNIKFARLSRDRNVKFKEVFKEILDNNSNTYYMNMKKFLNKDGIEPADRAKYAAHILANEGKMMIDTHTILKEKYNEMGFFKRWFTREGYHTRNAKNEIKATLEFISKKVAFTDNKTLDEFLETRTMDKVGKVPGIEAGDYYEKTRYKLYDREPIVISDEEILNSGNDAKIETGVEKGVNYTKIVGYDEPRPEAINLDEEIEINFSK